MNRKKAASPASPKVYRSIREVSAELEVKPHVLRYWETQFPSLRPKKNRAGNRMYRPEEVKLLTRIKELLYAQRFTIEGARRLLTDEKKPRATKATATAPAPAPTGVVPVAPVAAPAPAHDAERKRLEKALAAAQDELARRKDSLVAAQEALSASQAQLAEHKSSIATLDDRDKTRMAAMAVLRQELLLLARELRGEDEKPAPALLETRVTVKASDEPVERAATPDPELAPEREPEALPLGVVAVSVGA